MAFTYVRTKADFNNLTFELRRASKGYKEIITRAEALKILSTEASELGNDEMAEIAANGGCNLNNGDVLYAKKKGR